MKTVIYEAFSYFIFLYVRFTSPHLSIFTIINQHVSFPLTPRQRKTNRKIYRTVIIPGHLYVAFKDVQILPRRGTCIQKCVFLVILTSNSYHRVRFYTQLTHTRLCLQQVRIRDSKSQYFTHS
jgi:hypothetical protein